MAQVVEVKIEDNSEEVLEAMHDKVVDWLEAIGEDAAGTACARKRDTRQEACRGRSRDKGCGEEGLMQ